MRYKKIYQYWEGFKSSLSLPNFKPLAQKRVKKEGLASSFLCEIKLSDKDYNYLIQLEDKVVKDPISISGFCSFLFYGVVLCGQLFFCSKIALCYFVSRIVLHLIAQVHWMNDA